jgi:hypothetical protein
MSVHYFHFPHHLTHLDVESGVEDLPWKLIGEFNFNLYWSYKILTYMKLKSTNLFMQLLPWAVYSHSTG